MDTLDISSEIDLYNAIIDNVDTYKKPDNVYQKSTVSSKINMEQGKDDQQISIEEDNTGKSENIALHFSEARRMLQGVIEEIRFLSMTPADIVKINERVAVLTEHEILSLVTNILAPDSKMPIPAGFSFIKESRSSIKDSSAISGTTFRNTVIHVTRMTTGQKVFSPPCYVRNLAWRICAKRELVEPRQEFLGFYLSCDPGSHPSLSEDWSCDAYLELRLLSNTNSNFFAQKSSKFCKKNTVWGYPQFIEWSKLIDPMNNYIKDDSITLEVRFTTEPVKHFDLNIKHRRMREEKNIMMELDKNN
ncbi:MATH domain-containing protein [Phthorimaea operculella]|nr:MATH domain-containing protein [Phthorimaea operculella]